jgi:hypothetical protein
MSVVSSGYYKIVNQTHCSDGGHGDCYDYAIFMCRTSIQVSMPHG